MRGRDYDGAYRTDDAQRVKVSQRRSELRAAGKCINGPLVGNVGMHGARHGEVVRGGKCQRCIDVHRGAS